MHGRPWTGDRMHGTSIVIWLGSKHGRPGPVTNEGSGEVEQTNWSLVMPISDRIHVDFSVDSEVNYSLLHNNRELFDQAHAYEADRRPPHEYCRRGFSCMSAATVFPYRYTHSGAQGGATGAGNRRSRSL